VKVASASIIFCYLMLTGCAAPSDHSASNGATATETVLITYHVIPGKEQELQQTLADVWTAYRSADLVFARPHIVVREKDGENKTRFVEVFTWVSQSAPEHVPDSVKKLWDRMQACCEQRNGRPGIDGGEVQLVTPEISAR
jgi:hypothetical protein